MRKQGHGHAPAAPETDYLNTLGYETRDVVIPTLRRWLITLFVFVFGTIGITYGLYLFFVKPGVEEEAAFPLRIVTRTPPEPALQARPKRDMYLFRRREEAQINEYGWANEQKGIVRIPIDRAIDLTAQRDPRVQARRRATEPAAPVSNPAATPTAAPTAAPEPAATQGAGH